MSKTKKERIMPRYGEQAKIEAVRLRCEEQLNNAEIAARTGISVSTIHRLMHDTGNLLSPEECKRRRAHAFRDQSGKTFGRLVVLRRTGTNKHRTPLYECRCACGNIMEVSGAHLVAKYHPTRSCGCLLADAARKTMERVAHGPHVKKPLGDSAKHRYYLNYFNGAAQRGMIWGLTKEQVLKIAIQDCHYCGVPPLNPFGSGLKQKPNGVFFSNGIDRKDPEMGYLLDNVLPCCKICNIAKSDMSYEVFCAYLTRLVQFRYSR